MMMMVVMMMIVVMKMVAMVKLRRMMTRATKMKVFLKNSFRYYAIARPLQYHMVITGGSFPYLIFVTDATDMSV